MPVVMMEQGSDIFLSNCEVLVSPVNCMGVSGAGLAKQFKRRFPQYDRDYRAWCKGLKPSPGMVLLTSGAAPQSVIHFATKNHWKGPSLVAWIIDGLDGLCELVAENNIKSIGIPALGCGHGGLCWSDVAPYTRQAAHRMALSGVKILIYPPHEGKDGGR